MKNIEITPADVPLVCEIVSGLLASGHYTFEPEQDEPLENRLIRVNCGEDWKESGFPRRYTALAVEEAIELLREIKHNCEHDSDP